MAVGVAPLGVTTLEFGYYFNEPLEVGSLPATLETLTFGELFRKDIVRGLLPAGLKTLVLGGSFNSELLPGVLPSGITTLTFGSLYSHRLRPGLLPSSLKTLKLPSCYDLQLDLDVLPEGLETLVFGYYHSKQILPGPGHPATLPSSLTTLVFGYYFSRPIEYGLLPPGLVSLTFGHRFNELLEPGQLPSSIETLIFGECFTQPLRRGVLPTDLTTLKFGNEFIHELYPGDLPDGLTTLTFGDKFNQPIYPNILPPSITSLTLGSYFNQEVRDRYGSVTYLNGRVQPIPLKRFPLALEHLTVAIKKQELMDMNFNRLFAQIGDEPLDSVRVPPRLTVKYNQVNIHLLDLRYSQIPRILKVLITLCNIESLKDPIANFSISNLKGLKKDNFSELMLPVVDYLQFQNIKEKKSNLSCLKEKSFHPLTLFPWDTLESAIYKIVATKVHCLWVVDLEGRALSVVSIDSILKLLTMSRMDIAP
eukprot:gene6089-7052_t